MNFIHLVLVLIVACVSVLRFSACSSIIWSTLDVPKTLNPPKPRCDAVIRTILDDPKNPKVSLTPKLVNHVTKKRMETFEKVQKLIAALPKLKAGWSPTPLLNDALVCYSEAVLAYWNLTIKPPGDFLDRLTSAVELMEQLDNVFKAVQADRHLENKMFPFLFKMHKKGAKLIRTVKFEYLRPLHSVTDISTSLRDAKYLSSSKLDEITKALDFCRFFLKATKLFNTTRDPETSAVFIQLIMFIWRLLEVFKEQYMQNRLMAMEQLLKLPGGGDSLLAKAELVKSLYEQHFRFPEFSPQI